MGRRDDGMLNSRCWVSDVGFSNEAEYKVLISCGWSLMFAMGVRNQCCGVIERKG